MSKKLAYNAPPILVATKGGFVKEMQVKYMVMDDLVVKPMSAVSSITTLKDYFNVKDVGVLHEEVVQFGKEEALKLLKLSLDSKSVLTSLFMTGVKMEK
ncbi:hypothetical protein MTR67_028725 [Solanum verrucosum]|uniref:Uncharacterized protein n=2 Tax=Solanum TaxID=4107 RepID=A0AAF0R9W5_SOLVR|nr:hypothetical protein MTR67_028725 [Solanum verrucosum]